MRRFGTTSAIIRSTEFPVSYRNPARMLRNLRARTYLRGTNALRAALTSGKRFAIQLHFHR